MRPTNPLRRLPVALLAGFLVVVPATAEGPEEPAAEDGTPISPFILATGGRDSAGEARVYGNDDLERMFGGRSTPTAGKAEAEAEAPPSGGEQSPVVDTEAGENADPLAALFAAQERRKEQASAVAEAEQRVAQARQRIEELDKRLLAVRNPLLARPAAPEEGADEWRGMSGPERVRTTQDEIAAAREELSQAQQDLAELRRSGS